MSTRQEREFIRFVKLLHDNDLLKETILVGSWAEYLYEQTGILPSDYEANLRTLDVDFLLKNLRKPQPPKNLPQLARECGYAVENDFLNATTKIMGEGLEIEFLIGKRGRGIENVMKTNFGIRAQALRHMDILSNNTRVINYLEFPISIPIPEAYIIHKMIINEERGVKANKDINAVKNIYPYISRDVFERIESTLNKKERIAVKKFVDNYIE